MKYIMVNLNSNCEFWSLSEEQKVFLKSEAAKLNYELYFWDESEELNMEKLPLCEIYWGWNFNTDWLNVAKRLKWVIVPSAGKDHLPEETLRKHGIVLTTSTSYHSIPMSEQIMAYLLGFSRGIFQSYGKQSSELWWKDEIKDNFFDIYGKTMLIVGCGSVGIRLARIAVQFGINVLGFSRSPDFINEDITWIKSSELDSALNKADFVIDVLPINIETRLFFDKERLNQLKPGCVFINVGRGGTVDEEALSDYLENGHIAYSALDVFDPKPPLMTNRLRHNTNCLMTPKTGVFFKQYMDFASRFFLFALKKYTEFYSSINPKYAELKYINIALEKYFESKRMRNFENATYTRDGLLPIAVKQDKQNLIRLYSETGRNWPFLAFTINSSCNRQCVFCEAKNMEKDIMSLTMYRSLVREANNWNVTKAHLSGGEPTLRKEIVQIVQILNEELKAPNKQIGITTNGSCSYELIDQLIEAGVNTFNFSIHSFDDEHYAEIMGSGSATDALNKVKYVLSKGVRVKINCTLLRSYLNDAIEVIKFAKDNPVAVRIVELQNINKAKVFFDKEFVPEDELRHILETDEYFSGLQEAADVRDQLNVRSPGTYSKPSGWKGSFGFISNTSKPVCMDGNRIKVTPTGRIRPCTLEKMDIDIVSVIEKGKVEEAFKYLFLCFLTRDCNPEHRGYHYIDSDLRWDNYRF